MRERIFGVNSFALKLIAITAMLVDHIGAVLYPDILLLRLIGRTAFPIFVFLLVEGADRTGNIRGYEMRMFLFAFLSEIPFDLAFSGRLIDTGSQNVFFTLAIGLLMVDLLKTNYGRLRQFFIVVICMAAAWLLCTDYSFGGILLIFLFFRFRDEPGIKVIGLAVISFAFYGWMEAFSLLAMIPILFYNGKRGPSLKYVFYAFYPVHLLILYFIAEFARIGGISALFGGMLI